MHNNSPKIPLMLEPNNLYTHKIAGMRCLRWYWTIVSTCAGCQWEPPLLPSDSTSKWTLWNYTSCQHSAMLVFVSKVPSVMVRLSFVSFVIQPLVNLYVLHCCAVCPRWWPTYTPPFGYNMDEFMFMFKFSLSATAGWLASNCANR